jgi:hypothetical protein
MFLRLWRWCQLKTSVPDAMMPVEPLRAVGHDRAPERGPVAPRPAIRPELGRKV